jgi:hypothetical protein
MLDVDAEIQQQPLLFELIPEEYDIGVHYLDWQTHYGKQGIELLSGTLFIRNTPKIMALIDDWIELLPRCSWEQKALDLALSRHPEIKIFHLPREYCYIATQPNKQLPVQPLEKPVIIHHQVSRLFK